MNKKSAIAFVLFACFIPVMINAKTPRKFTYDLSLPINDNLYSAASVADIDFITNYIEKNPNKVNANISSAGSLLHLATRAIGRVGDSDQVFLERQTQLIEYLLSKGADIHLRSDSFGGTPLLVAARSPLNRVPILKLLLKHGADPKMRAKKTRVFKSKLYGRLESTSYGPSPLEIAASSGHSEMVEILIKAGAPVAEKIEHNSQHPSPYSLYHNSAILEACRSELTVKYRNTHGKVFPKYVGNKKVLALLLKEIKDINEIQGFGGVNALHIALDSGFPERAKFLLEKCPNLDASDGGLKGTPLDIVAKSKKLTKAQKTEMTKLLKAHIKKYQQAKNKSKLKTP